MATDGLAQFNRAVDKFAKNLEEVDLVNFHRAITFHFLRGVVEKTRVDTGLARGNWQVDQGSAPTGVIRIDKNGASTIALAQAKLRQMKPFVPTFITNNTSYILVLNDKLGDKMIERTIAELLVIFP